MTQQQAQEQALSRYHSRPPVNKEDLEPAIDFALSRLEQNLDDFIDQFPSSSSEDELYKQTDGMYLWTPSFWTGMLWLANEVSDDNRFRNIAEQQLDHYQRRLEEGRINHDAGFLYSLSAVAQYRITGDRRARNIALTAADYLAERYHEEPGIIQAWGDVNDSEDEWNRGRMIVDTMMNLPLLFWASKETGDERYATIATSHAKKTATHLVREDNTSYHTFQMDVETGIPIGGETHQGHADDSCWARGQTWTVYGFPLAYSYTHEDEFLSMATQVTNQYLSKLPKDDVPYWDLVFSKGSNEERDSSAAAIAACGLDELASHLPIGDERKQIYENASLATLESLAESYTTDGRTSNGILAEGVHNKPGGEGVNECCIWGDYFYLEGLVRATTNWTPYW